MSTKGIVTESRTHRHVHLTHWLVVTVFGLGLAGFFATAAEADDGSSEDGTSQQKTNAQTRDVDPRTFVTEPADVDRRWLQRLDDLDRALLNAHIGYAPPAFTADLNWHDDFDAVRQWSELHGKVVVVQSWTVRTHAGRAWPTRIARTLKQFPAGAVEFIALHTPDRAKSVQRFLDRRGIDGARVAVDSKGAFCDAVGFYKTPANIVIGRNGMVRYAGLSDEGVAAAVEKLIDEPCVDSFEPPKREAPDLEQLGYPPITGNVRNARDVRQQRAPDLHVQRWLTERPDAQGKVVIVEFWATWCMPCIANIPHMNKLMEQFDDDVACIAISNENLSDFQRGLQRRKLDADDFNYTLALDPSGRMRRAIQSRAIPHCIVMSSDWIVRWQGHPGSLNAQTLSRIVQTNHAAQNATHNMHAEARRYRWTER